MEAGMPRAKKEAEKYVIDFKFPNRDRDVLFKEDGTPKYTDAEIIGFAMLHEIGYSKDFAGSVNEYFKKNGNITDDQRNRLYNIAADTCPDYDELDNKFFLWYDSRPDMQEMYKSCTPNLWWFYDRYGQHHTPEVAKANGWHDRPQTWQMFKNIANSGEAVKFRELNREIKYDIGDMVQLRTPFVFSWDYDPCRDLAKEIPRVGTVVEHKDQISRHSRGGHGSRLINVLWLTSGETKALPERTIKKLPKQK
jgi:hypothetical protein